MSKLLSANFMRLKKDKFFCKVEKNLSFFCSSYI